MSSHRLECPIECPNASRSQGTLQAMERSQLNWEVKDESRTNIPQVHASVTLPATMLSTGPSSSSSGGLKIGFGGGANEGGSIPWLQKSTLAATRLSSLWLV